MITRATVRRPFGLTSLGFPFASPAKSARRQIGVARIDLAPDFATRPVGHAVRRTESSGAKRRRWPKAVAIGSHQEGPAIPPASKPALSRRRAPLENAA